MGLVVCPSALVEAPVERVWELLTWPEGYDHRTDATLVAVEPEGAVQPGRKLHFVTAALGWKFAVTIDVLEVDAQSHRLHLHVHPGPLRLRLPLPAWMARLALAAPPGASMAQRAGRLPDQLEARR